MRQIQHALVGSVCLIHCLSVFSVSPAIISPATSLSLQIRQVLMVLSLRISLLSPTQGSSLPAPYCPPFRGRLWISFSCRPPPLQLFLKGPALGVPLDFCLASPCKLSSTTLPPPAVPCQPAEPSRSYPGIFCILCPCSCWIRPSRKVPLALSL